MEKSHFKVTGRAIWICISLGVSMLSSYAVPQPNSISMGQLASLIVTTFSFLAGFLVAAIAVVGYSTDVVARHGWKTASIYRESFENNLRRYAMHFVLYLLSILIVMTWSLFDGYTPELLWKISALVCVFSLFMAFSLLFEILGQHISMYDTVVENIKSKETCDDIKKFSDISGQLLNTKEGKET